ncbi:MAG: hypothetical protein ACC628_18560 [Pirellulaceae bacterium]
MRRCASLMVMSIIGTWGCAFAGTAAEDSTLPAVGKRAVAKPRNVVLILADDQCDRHGEMAAEEAKNTGKLGQMPNSQCACMGVAHGCLLERAIEGAFDAANTKLKECSPLTVVPSIGYGALRRDI